MPSTCSGRPSQLSLVNNLITLNQSQVASGAFHVLSGSAGGGYNLYWDNPGGNSAEALMPGDVVDDPMLANVVVGDCDLTDVRPLIGSPALGAGTPQLDNPDGSNPSDIGRHRGGPDALADVDGDGYTNDVDCDDDDIAIHPRRRRAVRWRRQRLRMGTSTTMIPTGIVGGVVG